MFQTPAKSSGPEREEDDDEEGEEEPDTSYSRLFESGRRLGSDAEEDTDVSSVASEEEEEEEEVVKNKSKTNRRKKHQGGVAWVEDTDGDADDDGFNSDEDNDDQDRDADFYAPTPMKPPQSVRRSPRSAARIRKSLHSSLLFSTGKPRASGRMQMEAVVVLENPAKGSGDRKRKRMTLDEAYSEDESEGEAEDDIHGLEEKEGEDEAMESSASEDSNEDDEHLKRPTSSRLSNQPPRKRLRFHSTPQHKKKAPRPLKELPSNAQPHLRRRNPATASTTTTTTTTTMRTSPRKPSRRVSYIEPEASEDELMTNVNHVSATFSAKRMKGRRMRGLVMMRKAK